MVADRIGSVVVAGLTRTRRGLVSELLLSATEDGVPSDCVVNFDDVHTLRGTPSGVASPSYRRRAWLRAAAPCATPSAADPLTRVATQSRALPTRQRIVMGGA
jgi:hypothetical protein